MCQLKIVSFLSIIFMGYIILNPINQSPCESTQTTSKSAVVKHKCCGV